MYIYRRAVRRREICHYSANKKLLTIDKQAKHKTNRVFCRGTARRSESTEDLVEFTLFARSSKMRRVAKGFDATLANRPF